MTTLQWTVSMECYVYDPNKDKIYYGTIKCLSGIKIGNRIATVKIDGFDTQIQVPESALCQKAWQAHAQKNMRHLIKNSNDKNLTHLILFLNDMLQDPTTHISDENFEKLSDILHDMEKKII